MNRTDEGHSTNAAGSLYRYLAPSQVGSGFWGRLWLSTYWVATALVAFNVVLGVVGGVVGTFMASDNERWVGPAIAISAPVLGLMAQLAVVALYRWGLWLVGSKGRSVDYLAGDGQ